MLGCHRSVLSRQLAVHNRMVRISQITICYAKHHPSACHLLLLIRHANVGPMAYDKAYVQSVYFCLWSDWQAVACSPGCCFC